MEATEEIEVTNEELAEVHRHPPVHKVQEHVATRVLLLYADGQLVGEAADRLPRRLSEGNVRVVLGPQSGLLRDIEERSLVGFGTQPPMATIAQYRVEHHHPFDHAADRAKTTIAVVWLAN